MMLRHLGTWAAAMGLAALAACPSPIAASERPLPPKPPDRRPIAEIAAGDWYYVDGGHLACQSPGSTCLIITLGSVQLFVPLPTPSGAP